MRSERSMITSMAFYRRGHLLKALTEGEASSLLTFQHLKGYHLQARMKLRLSAVYGHFLCLAFVDRTRVW